MVKQLENGLETHKVDLGIFNTYSIRYVKVIFEFFPRTPQMRLIKFAMACEICSQSS
jgi:hypothetical protein